MYIVYAWKKLYLRFVPFKFSQAFMVKGVLNHRINLFMIYVSEHSLKMLMASNELPVYLLLYGKNSLYSTKGVQAGVGSWKLLV